MKKSLILAVKLFVICAIAAACLAFVNSKTAPVIQARLEEKTKEAYGKVFPEAEDFETLDDAKLLNDNIIGIVEAKVSGNTEGYVFNVSTPSGYDGPINFVIGVKNDGTVVGFEVLAQTETTGYGASVAEEDYQNRMQGAILNGPVEMVEGNGAEGQVPGISGATRTSDAMHAGFNAVVDKLQELLGGQTSQAVSFERIGGINEY